MKKYSLRCVFLTAAFLAVFSACGGGGGSPGPVGGPDPITLDMVYVPGGTFMIDTGDTTTPYHDMTITNGYWMGETEVTQELWAAVMTESDNIVAPSHFNGQSGREAHSGETQGKRPVEYISWYDTIEFCNRLSVKTGKDEVYTISGVTRSGTGYISAATVSADFNKNGYRLPTEMEWMWAAMGATEGGPTVTTDGYSKAFAGDDGSNAIGNYAWYNNTLDPNGGHSNSKTHEVGKKTANELGLYDMSGNVWEWCWDWYGSYPTGQEIDYAGAAPILLRISVMRGGGWYNIASFSKVAYRLNVDPSGRFYDLGFRVVRSQ